MYSRLQLPLALSFLFFVTLSLFATQILLYWELTLRKLTIGIALFTVASATGIFKIQTGDTIQLKNYFSLYDLKS